MTTLEIGLTLLGLFVAFIGYRIICAEYYLLGALVIMIGLWPVAQYWFVQFFVFMWPIN